MIISGLTLSLATRSSFVSQYEDELAQIILTWCYH